MIVSVTFSLRRYLQGGRDGFLGNLLTEETPTGREWLHLTLVTFSPRRHLQGGEGYLGNYLTEETRTGEKPSAF